MSDAPSSTRWTDSAARGLLRNVFDAAVVSTDPGAAVLPHLPEKPKVRCVAIGTGKASVAMAAALDVAASLALAAAARTAAEAGLAPLILGDAIEGESRELGVMMAGVARSCRLNGFPVKPPAVLLSGGETTVTIGKGQAGRGGRNTEFLLALPSRWPASPAFSHLLLIVTVSTEPKTRLEHLPRQTPLRGPASQILTRDLAWPCTTAIASLPGSATSCAQGRPEPT